MSADFFLFLAAGVVGGVVNSIAGGAKLFVFPMLLASGLPPIVANATGTAGVWPAQLPAAFLYRKELIANARVILRRTLPALAGSFLGAFALMRSSEAAFLSLIPFLLTIAVIAIALGPRATKLMQRAFPARYLERASAVLLFGCGLYAGYFGAGVGFMLIAVLSLSGEDYRNANAQKNITAFLMNTLAIAALSFSGLIEWFAAIAIAAGGMFGGYFGGRLTRVLPDGPARLAVAALGIILTVSFLVR